MDIRGRQRFQKIRFDQIDGTFNQAHLSGSIPSASLNFRPIQEVEKIRGMDFSIVKLDKFCLQISLDFKLGDFNLEENSFERSKSQEKIPICFRDFCSGVFEVYLTLSFFYAERVEEYSGQNDRNFFSFL